MICFENPPWGVLHLQTCESLSARRLDDQIYKIIMLRVNLMVTAPPALDHFRSPAPCGYITLWCCLRIVFSDNFGFPIFFQIFPNFSGDHKFAQTVPGEGWGTRNEHQTRWDTLGAGALTHRTVCPGLPRPPYSSLSTAVPRLNR